MKCCDSGMCVYCNAPISGCVCDAHESKGGYVIHVDYPNTWTPILPRDRDYSAF